MQKRAILATTSLGWHSECELLFQQCRSTIPPGETIHCVGAIQPNLCEVSWMLFDAIRWGSDSWNCRSICHCDPEANLPGSGSRTLASLLTLQQSVQQGYWVYLKVLSPANKNVMNLKLTLMKIAILKAAILISILETTENPRKQSPKSELMVLKWIVTTKSHNCQSTLTRVCDSRFEGCTVPVRLVYEPLNHRALRANAFMCELVSKLCTIGSDREICLTT